jgi:hypothetical protein
MKKNRYLLITGIISLVVLALMSIIMLFLFDDTAIKHYLLGILCFCIVLITILLWFIQKNTSTLIVDLTSLRDKIVQRIILIAAFMLSILVIPIAYSILSAILIILTGLISNFFLQKILVIDYRGIRYANHWGLMVFKWDNLDSYKLDEENGILEFKLKDGARKQITRIASKHYSIIEANINHFLKK